MRIFIVVLGLIYCAGASMASSVLIGSSACQAVAAVGPATTSAESRAIRNTSLNGVDSAISRDGGLNSAGHETQPVLFSKRVTDCD